MKPLSTICFVLILAGRLLAANHYVQTGAAGTRSGDDWSNAYTNLPSSLTRGDTYYIGNGNYPAWGFNDTESGTIIITVKKATVADHGTDTGWSSTYAQQAVLGHHMYFYRGFYTILGSYATTQNDPTTYGFKIAQPASCSDGTQHYISIGPGGSTVSNIFMSHIAATACPDDVEKFLVDCQTTTTHCNYGFTNFYANGFQSAAFVWGWQGGMIDRWYITNSFSSAGHHGATINVRNGPLGPTRNLTLRNSVIVGFPTPAVEGNDGGSDDHCADGFYIYGNVFANGTASLGVLATTTRAAWSHLSVFNNTFYDCDNGWLGGAQSGSSATVKGGCTNIVATNNIIAAMTATINDNTTAGIVHDYNLFLSATSIPSEGNGVTTNADWFIDSAAYNFRLATNTPAGATLASTFNTDPDGTTRTTWSRGAFEYAGGGGGDVTAPTCAITSPASVSSGSSGSYSTSSSTITVSGTSDDATATVTWSNSRGGAGTATGSTSWTKAGITLASGGNVLTFTATDPSANATTTTLNVTYTAPSSGGGSTNNVGTLYIR